MIKRDLLEMILKKDILSVVGNDYVDFETNETKPTIVYYISSNIKDDKPIRKEVSAATIASLCIIWCFKQGYNLGLTIEDSRNQLTSSYQFRVKVTPTDYAEKAFISYNSWDCIFGATEFIRKEINEQIDDLFAR